MENKNIIVMVHNQKEIMVFFWFFSHGRITLIAERHKL